MSKPILVTGAAGFIGSHTCERLLKEGYGVVGIDNLRTGKLANLDSIIGNPQFTFMPVDCLNEWKINLLFDKFRFDRVLHLAALVSVPESFEKPELNFELNVQAVDVISRACSRYEASKLVFASSAAVYGNDKAGYPYPLSPYAVAKLTSENLVKGYAHCYRLQCNLFTLFQCLWRSSRSAFSVFRSPINLHI